MRLPRFTRSKLHTILRDRSYIGEVRYHGQWYPGAHPPLVDRPAFDRVQMLLGECVYHSHEFTYAGELIACEHCGRPITGERKTKQTKAGPKDYLYYRCSSYNTPGHPRVRVTEAELDQQVLALFDRMRIPDQKVRGWFVHALRSRRQQNQRANEQHLGELNRQLSSLRSQQDRLLSLRLLDEVDEQTFAAKNTELRDRSGSGFAVAGLSPGPTRPQRNRRKSV